MNTFKLKRSLLISLFAASVALAGCQEQGPAEKAGEKIDNAADNVGDAIDDAADEVKDATN